MPLKFVIRFASILFSLLILVVIATQFLFSSKVTTDIWIISFPIILAIPILTSIVFAKNDEFSIHFMD